MRSSSTLNLGTGTFVLLGFAALAFLTTQTTSSGLHFTSPPHYVVTAKFDNIGDLKVGAPISMSGVEIGRVSHIDLDKKEFKAVVTMSLLSKYNEIPTDSDASIYTQGLLGGKYIGLTAGGSDTYLKNHGSHRLHAVGVRTREFDRSNAREFYEKFGSVEYGARGENEMRTAECRFHARLALAVGLMFGAGSLGTICARAQPSGTASSAPVAAAPAAVPNTLGPEELVADSAKRMLAELDAHRDMYAKDPAKLDSLVANVLLPNFDSEYAAKLVLGQTWRTATPDQRKRFVDAFYHSLLRNYGNALLNFTADRFVILPYRGDPSDTSATVRTEVKKSSGEKVPVNFSLRKTDTGWKAWDVVIEGISYVKSFRTDFAAEIEQKGLDEVIARLEKEGTVRANGVAGGDGH